MLKATPHLPTGLMLIAAITLYSATPATAELERIAPWQGARIIGPPAMRPDVRISLTAMQVVLGDLARHQAMASGDRLRFGGELAPGARGHGHDGGSGALVLDLVDPVPGLWEDKPRASFVSDIQVVSRPALLPVCRIGAWLLHVDPSAIQLARAPRVRPGDAVPSSEPFGIVQLALAF